MKLPTFEIPVGFRDLGVTNAEGFILKGTPDGYDHCRTFGGDIVRTHARYRLELKVDFQTVDRTVLLALCGDPLARLALQARRINPHWYLNGDPDD